MLKKTVINRKIYENGGFSMPREFKIFLGYKVNELIEVEFFMYDKYIAFRKKKENAIRIRKENSHGRIIIPKLLRELAGIKSNDIIDFFINEQVECVVIKVKESD